MTDHAKSGAIPWRDHRRELRSHGSTPLRLYRATLDELGPMAHRRGMSPGELARRILATVVAAGLVDVILDDGAA